MTNGKVENVMSTTVYTLPSTASCAEACREMREHDIGDVLVMEDDGSLCGVVTDRDIVVRVLAEQRDPTTTRLKDVCSQNIVTIDSSAAVHDAMTLMAKHAVRRVPVMSNGHAIGMLSLGDLAQVRDPSSVLGAISSAPPNH